MKPAALVLDGRTLDLAAIEQFERSRPAVTLAPAARARLATARQAVERAAGSATPTYGINTGFGAFATRKVDAADLAQLQLNLVRSHASGVGPALDPDLVRRVLLLKANALAGGYSGVRPEVIDALLAFLNADLLPVIPRSGSVGASGDLAPLAHLALALLGEGEARQGARLLQG
ncbi:MAG: aromatic amino acid lyase, partial [Steroidobacteraceae bacterium]